MIDLFADISEYCDEEVVVVDIAVPVAAQAPILRAAVAAGKHVLAQKPFATSPEVARELARFARDAGIEAAVNQQLRFEEGMAAAHRMVELGWMGRVTSFSITVNVATPYELWDWAQSMERLEIMVQGCFESTASSEASRGTLGVLYDYPDGRPDTLEVMSSVVPTDGWVPYPVTQRWFPDAFIGTIGSVLDGIATGQTSRSSVLDNVKTIELVAALYRSMESNEVEHLGQRQAAM